MMIGNNIKELRKKNSMTQQALADKLDVSFQAVSSWENDEYYPELSKLEELAKIFSVSISKLIEEPSNLKINEKIFDEIHMYTYLKAYAAANNLSQTLVSLPIARDLHKNQYRSGKENVPYIYHPLTIACHALALGVIDDNVISTCLLHDVVEDCKVDINDFPLNDQVKQAVTLLSFNKESGMTKEDYFDNIKKNEISSIVKVLDRANNISTMALSFSRKKIIAYIKETENYVLPILELIKQKYPKYSNFEFLLKYQMKSTLETIKALL